MSGCIWVGQNLGVAGLHGLKKIKSIRKVALSFRCKISYRFIVGKFEIAGKMDKREQKKK